jgi:predicted O-methyltransferase YrrM
VKTIAAGPISRQLIRDLTQGSNMPKKSVSSEPKEVWSAVDLYIDNLLAPTDAALEASLAASNAAELPPIQVTASQGKLLHLLARAIGAKKILEIGTLGGYSTIWMARALGADGHLITLEADSKHAEVARRNIAHAGLAEKVEVRLGLAIDTLPQLLAEKKGPFDLIFIDADKQGYPAYLEWSLKLSRKGTLIVADNVVRTGKIVDAKSDDANVQGARRFLEMLATDPRVDATAIQTVGGKGHDGFALGLVTA